MQKNLMLRHRMAQMVRRFFDGEGFIEVETPFLMRSTPEARATTWCPAGFTGAGFTPCPSRRSSTSDSHGGGSGKVFSDRPLFPDEDLRADRQPEFTQIDVEASFVDEDDILSVTGKTGGAAFPGDPGVDIARRSGGCPTMKPFPVTARTGPTAVRHGTARRQR